MHKRLLRYGVKERGTLGSPRDSAAADHTHYERLHVFSRNNFGVVQSTCTEPNRKVEIWWDLFGRSEGEGEIVKLKRLQLA